MRTFFAILIFVAGCSGGTSPDAMPVPLPSVDRALALSYVSPFVGSGGFGFGFGSSFPGALYPNGMAKVGPDTSGKFGTLNFLHYSGYWFGDNIVQGFSHMHLHGTGATDYGVLALMPSDGFDAMRTTPAGYQSTFQKASESASPGAYGLTLDKGSIKVELTATAHAAHHRYTFGKESAAHYVIIDLDHHLSGGTVPSAEVSISKNLQSASGRLHSKGGMSGGYGGYDVFFAIRASQPWTEQLVWSVGMAPAAGSMAAGTGVGFALAFDPASAAPVELQVGISLVSVANAVANLAAEMPDFSFDKTRAATAAAWGELLSSALVEGGTDAERRIFYSGLYHAFLMPSIQSDVDGSFLGFDGQPHNADGYHYMSDMSLWDTYRTLNPLYSLLYPDRALDFVRSLSEMAKEKGHFPKWTLAGGDSGTMVGASADLVVTDAYLKGIRKFDAKGAYAMMRAAALDPIVPPGGRGGRDRSEPYMMTGFMPIGSGGSVSVTTEYGRDDFALSNFAAALGETGDAAALLSRSLGYKKLFDPSTGFLRARNADGSLPPGHFDPTCLCADFVEANAWQSLWMPSYDVSGLAGLLGGNGAMVDKLTALFEQGKAYYDAIDPTLVLDTSTPAPYYWAGNEPDIHAAYLFSQIGRPDLTEKWARWALGVGYNPQASGLPGNDDGGTMSAWAVFTELGIYPLVGSDLYVIGSPVFTRSTLRVPGGTFSIVADGASDVNLYVQSADLDGTPLTGPILTHKDLGAGRTLHLIMGPKPSTWGRQ